MLSFTVYFEHRSPMIIKRYNVLGKQDSDISKFPALI